MAQNFAVQMMMVITGEILLMITNNNSFLLFWIQCFSLTIIKVKMNI